MIMKLCNRCGKKVAVGKSCTCSTLYKKDYNRFRRDKKIARFRASPEWTEARRHIIERDEGIDQYLYYLTGEIKKGESIHHIEPLSTDEGWKRRCDELNLISLSVESHSIIEYKYKNNKERVKLQELLFSIAKEQSQKFKGRGA